MDPISLVTTALTLASPYLSKAGEKIAENVGETVWKAIKKPFEKKGMENLIPTTISDTGDKEKLQELILNEINNNSFFKNELEKVVSEAQQTLNNYNQQNITNNSTVEKQVNINTVNGNITL